ncbi:MAG: HAMP domain-containing histidine kinase [Rhizobacter sp.]|nr:HAMP domain-containing histidine kinase [Rhizobacter sp.]
MRHHLQAHKRWHQRFRHSLRWRLVALFLLLAIGTVVVFVGGTRMALTGSFDLLVKPLLTDYVDRLATEIGSPPDLARAQALVARLPVSVRIDGPAVQWDSHPDRRFERGWMNDKEGHGDMRGLLSRTTADGHRIQFGLGDVIWRERHPWRGLVPLFGLLLLTLLAYATVRRLFRPLDDIRAGALRYGEGRFDTPIPVRRKDELGDLATQVNDMATGLHGMLKNQRALLLAISHELRSPLTRARLNAELSAESSERQALLRDLTLMGELITDLLEGERLAAGPAALKREATDLNTLLREVVATGFAEQPVQLSLADELPVLQLDRPRATLLLRNLIDNACRHGASTGEPVMVSTWVDGDVVCLSVRDHGPGVPEDQLSRLAEPFYRPDSARTRAAGGVGLGLYLCRLVAQSHGGTLALRNASPGLEATVRWPV